MRQKGACKNTKHTWKRTQVSFKGEKNVIINIKLSWMTCTQLNRVNWTLALEKMLRIQQREMYRKHKSQGKKI